MISNGRFDSKVDIASNDEFGYIARNFNAMADNLKKSMREKDAVTQELNELNCTLEKRVILKTQELREAHNNLIRTEGLAIAGTIASSIAHELSTPLSTLMGYCQLINRKIPEEIGIAPYCNIMEKEIERCSTIMTGMLNLTRISNEEKSLTDINAMITDMLLIVRIQADCANVTVKDELDPSIPHIMVNSLGLRQVFMNIIINALQSMPDGGEIHIATSLAEAGKKIEVTISDTGCGISETDMSRIFKSFYTTKKTGTGLGLSICYAIIQAHDGNIRVKSEIGKGTTINVFLPV
jgi:two-component system NtrC family sensor kinase